MFDLKAVNPNAIMKMDERTAEAVIQSIEEQRNIVTQSPAMLRRLLSNGMAE